MIGYCFALLLSIFYVAAENEIRIDWVGEPGHAQPQDSPSTVQPNALGPVYETRQAINIIPTNDAYTNAADDDNDDDLQQKQQEPIFGKGTYLEFDEQRIIKP